MPQTLLLTASSGCALEHREVLERGRVEHDVRPRLLEHLTDADGVADVGEHARLVGEQRAAVEHELHGVQRRLVSVEEVELRRAVPRDLPAELGADRAAGAGDEDRAAGEVAGDVLDVDVDLVPAEQVGDVDVADVGDLHLAVHDLRQRRQHLDAHARGVGVLDDAAHRAGGGTRDRDDDGAGTGLGDRLDHLVAGTEHGDARDHQALLVPGVVEQPDGEVGAVEVAQHVRDELGPGVAGAVDERGHGVHGPLAPVAPGADGVAHAEHPDEGEGQRDGARRQRDGAGRPQQRRRDHERAAGQGDRGDDAADLVERAVEVAAAVEVHLQAHEALHDRDDDPAEEQTHVGRVAGQVEVAEVGRRGDGQAPDADVGEVLAEHADPVGCHRPPHAPAHVTITAPIGRPVCGHGPRSPRLATSGRRRVTVHRAQRPHR